jgi:hypothetical protein
LCSVPIITYLPMAGNVFQEAGNGPPRAMLLYAGSLWKMKFGYYAPKMEQLFLQEKSFTSDNVIEISSMLDLKINEYMKVRPRRN